MKTAPTDEQTECSDRCRLATEASVKYAALAGRQLFSMIFIISSAGHFSPQTVVWAASHHVPLSEFLVPLSGLMALAGGLSVLLGFHTRFGGVAFGQLSAASDDDDAQLLGRGVSGDLANRKKRCSSRTSRCWAVPSSSAISAQAR